jgi:O-acetylserine/cysteine efflux transporter
VTSNPSTSLSGRELAAALAIVMIWGVNFVVMKLGLRDFTPFQLGAGRYVAAALPLVLLLRPPRVHWKWVLLYGLFQGVGQFGLLFWALQVGMTASLASVLLQTQVFFTALFGFVLLRERANRPLQAGLALAALGLACFALNYLAPGSARSTTPLGFVLSLGSAAMWAAANIVARKAQQESGNFDPLAFVVWSSLVPIAPFVLLSWWLDPPGSQLRWTHAAWSSWAALAFLGWIATIAAYGMWTGLLKRHPANRVAPFSLGVPIVGLSAGMLVLAESVTPWQWGGIVLVSAALACVLLGPRFSRRRLATP